MRKLLDRLDNFMMNHDVKLLQYLYKFFFRYVLFGVYYLLYIAVSPFRWLLHIILSARNKFQGAFDLYFGDMQKVVDYTVLTFKFIGRFTAKRIWPILKVIYHWTLRYVVIAVVFIAKKIAYITAKFIWPVIYFIYKYTLRYLVIVIVFLFTKVPVFKHIWIYVLKPFGLWVYKVVYKNIANPTMERKKALTGLAFLLPWIIGFAALVVYPFGRIIFMSFNNVKPFEGSYVYEWIGFGNFHRILRIDIDFVLQVQDFIVRAILYTPVIITLAIIVAMLLNQSIKGKGIFRMIFFLPIIILNGELLANMSEYGGMDITLSFFVLDIINTLVPTFAVDLFIELFGIIIEILWYTGVPILIFLAMLQKVDKSLYEAASIDGANSWSMFWKITLPIISPAITVSIIFIVVFLGNFDGNPINDNIIVSRTAQDRREGYASAMALIYSFIQIIVITILLFVSSGAVRDALLGRNRRKKHLSKRQKLEMTKKGA